jgi:hypothetical protein
MSIEFVILLALFTLLPIIEQWWRRHRETRERARRRASGRPAPPVPPPLPPPFPRVPPGHAPLPADSDRADEADEALEVILPRPVPSTRPRPLPPAPAAARRAPRSAPLRVQLRRDPHAVRRGVALMAVLGPCRAEAPYRWPDGR